MRVPVKKYNEPKVSTYRIVFRAGKWKMKSTRYWSVNAASEAFHDLYYVFKAGRLATKTVTIYGVERYDIYSHKWVDETESVRQHIDSDKSQYELASFSGKKIYLNRESCNSDSII